MPLSRLDEIKQKHHSSKWAYNILLQNVTETRAPSQIKWESELTLPSPHPWRDTYAQLYVSTDNVLLRWLQYRILHRILPTRKMLHMYGIIGDDACSLCRRRPETISHLFFSCEKTVALWHCLALVFERHLNQGARILQRDVILGTRQPSLNLGLLLFKAFIWRQCKLDGSLSMQHFKIYVKTSAEIQWHVAIETGKQTKCVLVWRPLCNALNIENSFFEPP